MTRIDFYVLDGNDQHARLLLVCRLAEKAIGQGHTVHIHASDPEILAVLDELLWTFRSLSFVPHRVVPAIEPVATMDRDPVQLSTGSPAIDRQVLINLADDVPAFFSQFERALEIVDQQPAVRDAGRARYRYYRHRGYPLQHRRM